MLGTPLAILERGQVVVRLRVKRVPAFREDMCAPEEPYEITWSGRLLCRIVPATADSPTRVIPFANLPPDADWW